MAHADVAGEVPAAEGNENGHSNGNGYGPSASVAADAAPALSILQLLTSLQGVQSERAQAYALLRTEFQAFLSSRDDAPFKQLMARLTAVFNDCSLRVRTIQATLRGPHQRADLALLLDALQDQERDKLRLTLTLQALRQAHALQTFSWQHDADVDSLQTAEERVQAAVVAHGSCGCSHMHSAVLAAAAGASSGHAHSDVHSHQEHGDMHAETSGIASGMADVEQIPGDDDQQAVHGAGTSPRTNSVRGAEAGVTASAATTAIVPEATEAEWTAAVHEATQLLDACVTAINDVWEELRYEVADLGA